MSELDQIAQLHERLQTWRISLFYATAFLAIVSAVLATWEWRVGKVKARSQNEASRQREEQFQKDLKAAERRAQQLEARAAEVDAKATAAATKASAIEEAQRPRRLSEGNKILLRDRLRPFVGRARAAVNVAGGGDSAQFAQDLWQALQEGGIRIDAQPGRLIGVDHFVGVVLHFSQGGNNIGEQLLHALREMGFHATAVNEPGMPVDMVTVDVWDKPPR